eukprot:Phypoly_transcript_01152.p1 GENE.Phypoly_transcript_01152~~Phypoly_transcript_01152.p1  ORF type:complete len:1060 (-),score=94.29 Phypoly_transcript_01152:294-3473(-)
MQVHQGLLVQQLEAIFKGSQMLVNTHKYSNVKKPDSDSYLELDVWISEYNLCFEFQDTYHYSTTWYYQKPQESVLHEDDMKKGLVLQQGLSLIVIPCWWDGSVGSLSDTIYFQRPDLLPASWSVEPIPMNPPPDFFQSLDLPGIKELMLASFVVDNNFINQNTWWMGEKYDGIRCCWNPDLCNVYTRNGREIELAENIPNSFPYVFIDGEFWFGRGAYNSVCGVLVSNVNEISWDSLRMITFDIPSKNFENLTFENRYKYLLYNLDLENPICKVAPRILRKNKMHQILAARGLIFYGGEGLIMRKVGSYYERGRSPYLVKIKGPAGDQEAVVTKIIGHQQVILAMPNGSTLQVPYPNADKNDYTSISHGVQYPSTALCVGDIVTIAYTHRLHNHNIPVNAQITRVRHDLLWEDVLCNLPTECNNVAGVEKDLEYSGTLKKDKNSFSLPRSSMREISNRRKFFEIYAKKHGFDPLSAKSWYNQQTHRIVAEKGAYTVIAYHKRSVSKALCDLFPNIGLESVRHDTPVAWHDIKANRRNFFINYAKQNAFDHLVPENWYIQPRHKILTVKGAASVIYHHDNSLAKALLDLFPNIGLEKSKLAKLALWHNTKIQRMFFEKYAKDNKFDPLVAENWYLQSKQDILATKGAKRVIYFHKFSVSRALIELFPEVALDRAKLFTRSSWSTKESRRMFFEDFATKQGFDACDPERWYEQSRDKIMLCKGASNVLFYYEDDLPQALLMLFPNIGLDMEKLLVLSEWNKADNRKQFFCEYAKHNFIDPLVPENWYMVEYSNFQDKKAQKVLAYHSSSIEQALVELFPNIGIDPKKFLKQTSWNNVVRRRKFFEKYAKSNGFDPLDPKQWYTHPAKKILAKKGASSVLFYHKNSIAKALCDLFPDIGLQRHKLSARGESPSDVGYRKKVFINYAQKCGFDPFYPHNWYSQPLDQIMLFKSVTGVISYHNNSVAMALLELFPNIGLVKEKLWTLSSWSEHKRRRKFFEDFARKNGFEPLIPKHWYEQSRKQIMSTKGVFAILQFHKGNISKALVELFPDVNFDQHKLQFKV